MLSESQFVLPDQGKEKIIHGFGENHGTEESEAENVLLKGFLEGLEKSASYRDGPSLHIFLEKGPPTYCPITRWRGVLSDLDEAVEGEGVEGVTVEDIEIRCRMLYEHQGAFLRLYYKNC